MKRLENKTIYYFITGAKKAKLASIMIKEMISEGAKVFTIPTKASLKFINIANLRNIKGNIIKTDWSNKINLPKEDAVLIAPCTFNTLNSIAAGLANTYPLCLIASSLGGRVPIFIAPAMNKFLWNHPSTQESIKKLEKWNCRIIWPEAQGTKISMMNIGKILDTIYFSFKRINYLNKKIKDIDLDNRLKVYRKKYLSTFIDIGKFLKQKNLNLFTAGCISVKIPEGFLITSSGAEIANLQQDEISLIVGFDEKNNLIEWVGNKLPSSESPLHCIIQKQKNSKIVLHFHCPKMTYSVNLEKFNTISYDRYGTFAIGHRLLKILGKEKFCIMKYHGEVVLGDNTSEIKKSLIKFNNLA
jgi:ribulose-5-phosphate 4-epimerase/fuculose-1-phosphate aldolase